MVGRHEDREMRCYGETVLPMVFGGRDLKDLAGAISLFPLALGVWVPVAGLCFSFCQAERREMGRWRPERGSQ